MTKLEEIQQQIKELNQARAQLLETLRLLNRRKQTRRTRWITDHVRLQLTHPRTIRSTRRPE